MTNSRYLNNRIMQIKNIVIITKTKRYFTLKYLGYIFPYNYILQFDQLPFSNSIYAFKHCLISENPAEKMKQILHKY